MSSIQSGGPSPFEKTLQDQQNAVQGVQVPTGIVFFDQMSPSQKNAFLDGLLATSPLMSAQNPSLVAPKQFTIDPNDPASGSVMGLGSIADVEETKHQIIITMLDTWLKSVHEQAQESKKADQRRAIEGISIAYHTYMHQIDTSYDPNFPIISVGLILGTLGIHQAILPSPQTETAINPVAQMSQTAIPPVLGDMRAELGLIGAMTMYGYILQYGTNAEYIKTAATGKELDPQSMAQRYGDNVMSVVNDPEFNNFITAIFTQNTAKGETLSQESKNQALATVKIILLASALQAYYLAETGSFSGKEFNGMLDFKAAGSIVLNDNDPRLKFIYEIQKYMDPENMSDLQRSNLRTALTKYFDDFTQAQKERAMNTLTNPSKVLAGVYAAMPKGDLAA